MNIQVQFKLDDVTYMFRFDEKDEMECLHRAAVLGNPPQYCHECKNDKFFKLSSNKDKEANIYVNIRCNKCGACAKLGQYKAGGYFWHKFEQYIPKGGKKEGQDVAGQENQAAEADAKPPVEWDE